MQLPFSIEDVDHRRCHRAVLLFFEAAEVSTKNPLTPALKATQWKVQWHHLIDAIADVQTPEEFREFMSTICS
jgi:LmbE family N-acetylglucosaminyl deacetylase